jgi:drug/metabolite transporter (DMT)-like permease
MFTRTRTGNSTTSPRVLLGLAAAVDLSAFRRHRFIATLALLLRALSAFLQRLGGHGQAAIGAARAAYIGVKVPIVALAMSFFFEKFAWGWLTTVGVALSVMGNVLMLRQARKQRWPHYLREAVARLLKVLFPAARSERQIA